MILVVIMGVSGTGKTTIGRQLAEVLDWQFQDADAFHSPRNRAKMQQGKALTDSDRQPWIMALNTAIESWYQAGQSTVLACSALKETYRRQLIPPQVPVEWIYLKGSYTDIRRRLDERRHQDPSHFMHPELLQSQLDSLEEPQKALWVDIMQPPEAILKKITNRLRAAEYI